jgi:hypothetical protein
MLSALFDLNFSADFLNFCQDMKSAQARASVETLREVQNDKALKTKAEKERRLRQVNPPVMKKLRV